MGKDNIKAGMSLIREWNKLLVLLGSFGWDVALCSAKKLLGEDSDIEHLKSKLEPRRRYSAPVKSQLPASGFHGLNLPQWNVNCKFMLASQGTNTLCLLLMRTDPPSSFGKASEPPGRFPNPNIAI